MDWCSMMGASRSCFMTKYFWVGWDDYRFLMETSSGFFSPSYLPFENGPYLNSLVPAELRPEAGRTRQCC